MNNLTPDFYSALQPSETYLEQLDRRMWLMDNHKWASYVWENSLGRTIGSRRPALLHFDYHFDGINDFDDDPEATAALLAESVEQLKQRIKVEDRLRLVHRAGTAARGDWRRPFLLRSK